MGRAVLLVVAGHRAGKAAPAARSGTKQIASRKQHLRLPPPCAEVTDETELNRARVTYNHNGTMSRSTPRSQPIWAPDIC